ncbi:SPOR domain-containing protein [Psychrobacter sp. FDAARGOS_221]|uniref:SPOR domain-containing protein n=1 Tax=Psychrobacter sp. FDAARGOS_221 TaxID=1975705 RepID=UPI000BB55FD4|nr:SPOR domain-containing protein [Psychrobacter sp. FDAARGOS_221]PNK60455.1 SPOR domain-containing protein [Psychrobacter sp. FDAARGOS_221]
MLAKKPKGGVQKRQSSSASSLLWIFVGAVLTIMLGLGLFLLNPFEIGSEEKVEERTVEPINQQPVTQTENYEFYDLLPDQEMISLPDEAVFGDTELPDENVRLQPDVVLTRPETEATDSQRRSQQPRDNQQGSEGYGVAGDEVASNRDSDEQGRQSQASSEPDIVIVEESGSYEQPNAAQGSNQTASAEAKPSYILQINSYSNAEEADKRRAQVLLAGVDAKVIKNSRDNGQTVYQVVSSSMTSKQAVAAALQKLQNNGIDALVVEQRR